MAAIASMGARNHVSVLLTSLTVAGMAAAHPPGSTHAGTATGPRRAHQSLPADAPRSRSGSALQCTEEQQSKSSVVMRTHRIVRGDSLSGVAALYGTSVQALALANGLRTNEVIRTGQELVIPQQARPGGGNDWLKYARSPNETGWLTLDTYTQHFHGRVLEKGRISPTSRAAVSTLLGVKGDRPPVPERLLRLLVRVSDTFGGRPIRVVSGYRTSSYFEDSRHKHSAAVDFSIAGVPNAVVRQYLLLFDDVGVGYYPNSSFVHLDVRGCAVQWVDFAGPGEAPRQRRFATRSAAATSVSDLDEIAESVAAVLNGTVKHHDDSPAPSDATGESPSPAVDTVAGSDPP